MNKLCKLWLLLVSLFTSCFGKKDIQKTNNSGQMGRERFFYEVTCSAPRLSPIEYLNVEFIGESGTLRCFGTPMKKGGIGTGLDGVCRDIYSRYGLPKAIEATWASYADRKVYSVASLVPYDTILALFKDGGVPCKPTPDEIKIDDLTHIIKCFDLCLMPGGKVMLYLKAPVKTILLDWSAVGTEVTDDAILRKIYRTMAKTDMDSYFDEAEEYPPYKLCKSYREKKGSCGKLFDRYIERFNYSLNFEFEDPSGAIYGVGSEFTNGEEHDRTSKYNECFKMPSRLKKSRIVWDTKDFHYTCFMYFNEEEMLRVFDEAYGDDRTQKGELKIKVSKYNNLFDLSLNVGDQSIKLKKTEIRVFQDPIEDPNGDGTLIYKNYEGDHKNLFADDKKYVFD